MGMLQTTKTLKFLQALQCKDKSVISYDELKAIATSIGIQTSATILIDAFNVDGFLIEKGSNINSSK